ncbi:MAG TPA: PhoH family protein [Gemmataceae bacterium]|jgi:phosphate starvation-inducible PhoH-like protein
MSEATITLDSRDEALLLFGSRDQYLREIRTQLGIQQLVGRGDQILLKGTDEQLSLAERVFGQLRQMLRQQGSLSGEDVKTVLEVVLQGGERIGPQTDKVAEGGSRYVRPRTDGQARYVRAMREHDLTICIGPAGTGKTWLAVGMAVSMLRQALVKKIVLVRPAVEAGERLGFLPGDIAAKVNPYLRPLFDALNDMMESEQVKRYMENDIIEIVPLAFMRGRAQPVTSKVLTPAGFQPIGSLQIGDFVIGSAGRPTRVEGVFPQGIREIYKVTFSDGASTHCCGEHLWSVHTRDEYRRGNKPRVLQTREMIGKLRCGHNHRYELPLLTRPVKFSPRRVPIDPYALGLLLGDGCLTGKTTPTFATTDFELVGALQGSLPAIEVRHKSGVDYVLNRKGRGHGPRANPLTVALRELGLCGTRSGTKFIPDDYLFNTAKVRLAVLQGLLDTDGGPVVQEGRTSRIHFCTTAPHLRDDVLFLVRSLGGVATWRIRAAAERKPGCANGRPVPYRSDTYVLDIRLPNTVRPFRLSRKAKRYEETGIGRPMRFVHTIEPDGVEETVCIRVAAEDSLYVTDDFILTHNTLNQAVILLDEGQNTTIPQMKMFLTRMGSGSKIIVTGDVTQVDLPKQTRSGLTDAVHRLRDMERIALVYLDEHDIVRNPLVQQILRAYEDERPRKKKE